MRGKYKLNSFPGILGEHRGANDYAFCSAPRKDGGRCSGNALNYSGLCAGHGGRLHPLDKVVVDWENTPRHMRLKYGKLDLDELDDEELSRGQVRKPDGTFSNFAQVPAEMHHEMVRRLFDRADEKMRNNLLDMVDVMTDVAKSPAYEPADRLRAAEFVFKWLRGSTPIKVELGVSKPFEDVLNAVLTGGSRRESREARGLGEAIDAEVVDIPDLDRMEMMGQQDEVVVEEEAEIVIPPRYDSPEERSVGQDLEARRPVYVGPAGRETHDVPANLRMDDTNAKHATQVEAERQAERKRRSEFAKKRPEDATAQRAREVAEARKAHKDQLRDAMKARKGAVSRGFQDVDHPAPSLAEDNGDGTTTIKFGAEE